MINLNRCTFKVHLEEESKVLFSEDLGLYLEKLKGKLVELMRKNISTNQSSIRWLDRIFKTQFKLITLIKKYPK